MKAVNLKINGMSSALGIDPGHLFLSWEGEGGVQSAHEVQVIVDGVTVYDEKKEGKENFVSIEPVVHSRSKGQWRVRLYDENDEAGEYSDWMTFEAGLLNPSDYEAVWITPEMEKLKKDSPHQPAGYLKKSFDVKNFESARLYITAHGVYEAFLNGNRVSDAVLMPGSAEFEKRQPVQTYDVSDLLLTGENTMEVKLGDGWYRSTSGVDGIRNVFGDDLSLLAQLEADGKAVLKTDASWLSSTNGPLRMNDLQQGETYDARMEEISDWHEVKVLDPGYDHLMPSDTVFIKEHEVFEGKVFTTPDGNTVIDYGQNLAGYIEFTVNAHRGDVIELVHGETLDENGNFTQENFQDRKRHAEGGTAQTITYICKEGVNHYKSCFTIMGFRYALVKTEIDLSDAEFQAIAVYSDMKETASFHSGNADLNQLFKNSMWSMKGNFCDIPTDCPTRERAGWTGDAGVFVYTGLRLMDSMPVFRKWLRECQACQYEDGKMANIAPKVKEPSMISKMLASSVGWGDASVLVPWAVYQYTGDISILAENYAMMKKWYTFLENRAAKKPLKKLFDRKNPYEKYTVDTGMDYGEWCEPGVGTEAMKEPLKSVGTAYLYQSGKLLAEIADLLGYSSDAVHFRAVSDHAKKAYQHVFTEDGKITSERQAEYVRPLAFGLLEEKDRKQAASDLNDHVVKNDYHLNTGFLSTPYLCEVLSDYGYVDTAYRLLLQTTAPSWLYEVKKGATTVFETWTGVDENGHPSQSLNHYSYGAVCGWLIKGVLGIDYRFDSLRIAPVVSKQLGSAEGYVHTPKGKVVSSWKIDGDTVTVSCTIPDGVECTVVLPDGREETVKGGSHTYQSDI